MSLAWLGFVPVLLCASWQTENNADKFPLRMDSVIGVLEDMESHLEGTPDLPVIELFREIGCKSEFCQLSPLPATPASLNLPYLSEKQRSFLRHLQNHKSNGSWVEYGAVLTPDGTTVALSPLLGGIAGGLKRRQEGAVPAPPWLKDPVNNTQAELCPKMDSLLAPLATDLAVAFSLYHAGQASVLLGPNGCWDNISAPHTFTLLSPPSPLSDAVINGAMDGVILGTYLAKNASSPSSISNLLNEYYAGEGLAGDNRTRSNFRRRNFADLVSEGKLREQLESSLCLLRHLHSSHPLLNGTGHKDVASLVVQAVEEFTAQYVECPAIIPRCMWEAQPYRGTPTQLQLPLSFVYIHHTHRPRKPCRTFPECAADMRSMQHFHQVVRGWDDIGYSFVVGGDGYIYQGRGWQWVGAHTLGHNSKGYGVSFIGDYMEVLPDGFALELVKDNFLQCAARGSRLKANYTVYGHRQVVPTLCPGDRLFQEIKTWTGFKERCFMKQGIRHCV
ncbi:N-acetylmuramoyl-L-alanine amidase [Paroedura picta]|uniref:N-acetylmuramoyl-L-alanine amidase n=1 Tax=Paroedura picta TaxID=143630 RepID=UPI004055CA02